jgi:hypothetical protein
MKNLIIGMLMMFGPLVSASHAIPTFDASNCWQTPGSCREAVVYWTARRWHTFPTQEAGINIVLNHIHGGQYFPVRTILPRTTGAAKIVFNPRQGRFFAEVFGYNYGPRVIEITGGGTYNIVVPLTPGRIDPRDL